MKNLKPWLNVVLTALTIGLLMRAIFFFMLAPKDLTSFSDSTKNLDIFRSFLLGSRFDLSAICYISLLFWLVSFVVSLQAAKKIWLLFLTFWSFLLIIDIGYYSFYNDRINVLIFGLIEDDTWALILTMWKNYPVIWILLTTLVFFLIFKKVIRDFPKKALKLKTRILTVILLFIGGRGTFGLFPLGPDHTVISSSPFLNVMSYGTAHAFMRAIKLKQEQEKMGSTTWNVNMQEFGYTDASGNLEDKAFTDFFEKPIPANGNRYDLMKRQTPSSKVLQNKKPHVLLYVMESWGVYGLQFHDENFDLLGDFKSRLSQDPYTFHMQSSTPGTAGSLSCLLSGLPQRTISPFLTESNYLNITFSTSPALLYKKHGYHTRFVYGGNPGWRDINKFALRQGFDQVEGEVDIEKKLKDVGLPLAGKHDWGIYDEDLFKYIEVLLKEAKSPQLIVVMTTSNHPPYELPVTYKRPQLNLQNFPELNQLIDPKLAQKRFETFRYSSDKLNESIDRLDHLNQIEKQIDDFVLAVTADHSFWIKNFSNDELFLKNAVPFYMHMSPALKVSEEEKKLLKDTYGSQHDIWPTLYNLSLNQADYLSFGQSLFQVTPPHCSIYPDRLIFNSSKPILITPSAEPTNPLVKKYRALMSCLDSYLYHSKMNPL